ncbi:hypothetical protein O181_067068 [Austropuccinia psidii MF-1]|uniref:Uncharacterized protein n=1 Tax=Austropuccinia psidii MF-1 TaxID=1389203 RepID=A0A9Q3EY64_9BASI|nr:hypothetical protein [Austropuccinia psidii MF-1]
MNCPRGLLGAQKTDGIAQSVLLLATSWLVSGNGVLSYQAWLMLLAVAPLASLCISMRTTGPEPGVSRLAQSNQYHTPLSRPSHNISSYPTMNTPGSMALGWGLILVAGGSGLYFAKRDIKKRRMEQTQRGIRSNDTREWHERLADQEKKNPNQASNIGNTQVMQPDTKYQSGLSQTFSKFDLPLQKQNVYSRPKLTEEEK